MKRQKATKLAIPGRIRWGANHATAEIVYAPNQQQKQEFTWGQNNLVPENADRGGGLVYTLHWGGMLVGDFDSDIKVKCAVIRFVYDLEDGIAIPSELLRVAGLVYVNNRRWIDTWNDRIPKGGHGYAIGNWLHNLDEVPLNRKIQLAPSPEEMNHRFALTSSSKHKSSIVGVVTTDYHTECKHLHIPPQKPGESNLRPVPLGWWDCGWEARVYKPLGVEPNREFTDDECTYIVGPEKALTA